MSISCAASLIQARDPSNHGACHFGYANRSNRPRLGALRCPGETFDAQVRGKRANSRTARIWRFVCSHEQLVSREAR